MSTAFGYRIIIYRHLGHICNLYVHWCVGRLNVVPGGIQDVLLWISERYNFPPIVISENGVDVPDENTLPLDEALHDQFRIDYFREYLANVMGAKEQGAKVQGYFAWSLLVITQP